MIDFGAVRAGIITGHTIAAASTCLRLVHRIHIRKYGYDDFWAFISLMSTAATLGLYLSFISGIFANASPAMLAGWFWSTIAMYTIALWGARISVAVIVVRLAPPGRFRTTAKAVVCFMGAAATVTYLQKFSVCKFEKVRLCRTRYASILEVVNDLLANAWLFASPIYMLSKMDFPKYHYRLIQTIFVSGLFVSAISTVHVVFIFLNDQIWIGITAHFEAFIALIVSNLLVVGTFFFDIIRCTEESDAGSTAPPNVEEDNVLPPSLTSIRSSVRTPGDLDLAMFDTSTFDAFEMARLTSSRPTASHGSSSNTAQSDRTNRSQHIIFYETPQ